VLSTEVDAQCDKLSTVVGCQFIILIVHLCVQHYEPKTQPRLVLLEFTVLCWLRSWHVYGVFMLQDILHDVDMTLDWFFRLSLMSDVLNVSCFVFWVVYKLHIRNGCSCCTLCQSLDKIKSKTANYARVPPLGQLDQTQPCLTSDWCRHLANWTKHNVVLEVGPLSPLCENLTSSTKKIIILSS